MKPVLVLIGTWLLRSLGVYSHAAFVLVDNLTKLQTKICGFPSKEILSENHSSAWILIYRATNNISAFQIVYNTSNYVLCHNNEIYK